MATRSSILRRSKEAERRVVKALWGDEARRDWKEDHDVSGPDADGNLWLGEVKNTAWPAGPRRTWWILRDALGQAEQHGDRAFAAYLPPKCEVDDALVMVRRCGAPVVMPLAQFRETLIDGRPWGASGREAMQDTTTTGDSPGTPGGTDAWD